VSASASAAEVNPGDVAAGVASSGVEEAVAPSLELQELTFTTEVKGREPVDQLVAAEPGKRAWVHLRLRNRAEATRKVNLQFFVNGDRRTLVDLQVEKSWSYRTWAYNTLLPADKSRELRIVVTADSGEVLAETSVPIAAKAATKPYQKKGP